MSRSQRESLDVQLRSMAAQPGKQIPELWQAFERLMATMPAPDGVSVGETALAGRRLSDVP